MSLASYTDDILNSDKTVYFEYDHNDKQSDKIFV